MTYLLQALAGAVGGFTAWLLAFSLDTDIQLPGLRELHPALIILVHLFFGALASFVGTFLAKPNEGDKRNFLIFCLLSGMTWRPVLDGGQSWIGNSVRTTESRALRQAVEAKVQNPSPQITPEDTKRVEALLEASAALPSQSERKASEEAVQKTIDVWTKASKKPTTAPSVPIEALVRLYKTAKRTQRPDLAENALRSIKMISKEGATPEIQEHAKSAEAQIRGSKDRP